MDNDDDTIAIVGIGCKFPGAENKDEFWNLLLNGENHVIEIPPERWKIDHHYDPNPDAPGKTYVRRAGFIESFDEWDNRFFGISDVESERMDPQHKFVLDCVHMAMEDGGFTRKQIAASDTGVYIGAMNDDYKLAWNDGLEMTDNYSLTGSSPSIISSRVSFVYNLHGPSMVIDTACSSSLVAMHVAAQAIKSGDCSMAICGGVNCILYPDTFIPLSKARMVSPTGQCHTFTAEADGYARGEGCGIVILKKKKQAITDCNKIWAEISTGCNQDGRMATPITAPSGEQQEKLLQKVYSAKNINAADIQYIEAHGTGTPVGDLIEVNALGNYFGKRNGDEKIFIGSVKTNIGHQESAAGVAGLIKTLLMMKHGKIVPSLFFSGSNANKKIDFENFGFVVPTEIIEWKPTSDKYRVSCVNSFGFGGTNSHAVIKQTLQKKTKVRHVPNFEKTVVAVSANDPISLELSIKDMVKCLENNTLDMHEIAYTSTLKRDHFQFRNLYVAATTYELLDKCKEKLKKGEFQRSYNNHNVVYVFCGVGTTWPGMCQKLISEEPVFAQAIAEIDMHLFPMANFKISNILENGFDCKDSFLNHIAIFSCQVGLAAVWKKWGVIPSVVVGQSVGEVAAAFVAGLLSLEDAVKVVFYRSKELAKASGGGKMIAVGFLPTEEVENICKDYNNKVNIAVYSSPISCTIAGDSDAINTIKNRLLDLNSKNVSRQIVLRELQVRCAYHSHHTNMASIKINDHLHGLNGNMQPDYPIVSSVTGDFGSKQDFVTAKYWERNIRQPVLFSQAIETTYKENMTNIYLEIGPKPVLKTHLDNILPEGKTIGIISMATNTGKLFLLESLSKLYVAGINPMWENIVSFQSDITEIPRYQFHKQKRFFEPEVRIMKSQGIIRNGSHHLFIERTSEADVFRVRISPENTPFIYQHFVSNHIFVPGAFYTEIGFEVGKQFFKTSVQSIQISTTFVRPVRLVEKQSKTLFAKVTVSSNQKIILNINDGKDEIASCTIKNQTKINKRSFVDIEKIRQRCHLEQSEKNAYINLENLGFSYGEGIRFLGKGVKNDKECLIEINSSELIMKDLKDTNIHPAILDGLLQTPGVLQKRQEDDQRTILPAGIGRVQLQRPPTKNMYGYAIVKSESNQEIIYNAILLTKDGSVILEVKDFIIRYIDVENNLNHYDRGKIIWKKFSLEKDMKSEEKSVVSRKTLIISYNKNDSEILASYLETDTVSISLAISQAKEEELKNTILTFCDGHENNNSDLRIIFLSGRHDNVEETGEIIFTRTLDTSKCFLELAKTIHQMKAQHIPIFLITEATQSHCINNPGAKINVCGSELWGLTRSILLESNLRIYLLDVFPGIETNKEALQDLLLQPPLALELAINNGSIFVSEYVTFQDASKKVELIPCTPDELCRVEVRSHHTEKIEDPFLFLTETIPLASDEYRIMHIEEACIHSLELFPLVLQTSFEDSIWPEDNADGYGALSLEVKGYTSSSDIGSYPAELKKTDMCVACYPVNMSNYVSIPKECICRLAEMPFYRPGLLSTLNILWCIYQHLLDCENICIIVENQDSIVGKLLESMFKKEERKNISIVTPKSIETNGTNGKQTAVLLDKLPPSIWKSLMANLVDILKIITIRPFLPVYLTRVIKQICPGIEIISLETDYIFDYTILKKVIPKLRSWMQSAKIQKDEPVLRSLNTAQSNVENNVFPLGCQTMCFTSESTEIPPSLCIRRSVTHLFRKKACYIVVGGLTGLGWEIVMFLVNQAAGHIITMSRTIPSKSKRQEIEYLNKSSESKIESLSVDICDLTSLQNAVAEIKIKYQNLPIKGIFHGAGVLRDVIFLKMTNDQMKEVYLPKIQGTWNLHLISQEMPLDFFILHSSITSVIGNFGQSNYGAANSFMDTFALYRNSLGLCAQSINWGPLSVGMAAEDQNTKNELIKRGYEPLSINDIHTCLTESIKMNYQQVSFGKFDWKIILRGISNTDVQENFKNIKFCTIGKELREPMSFVSNEKDPSQYRNEWNGIIEDRSENQISKCINFVRKIFCQVFAVDIASIDSQTTTLSLGIDSMLAMTLVNKLYEATAIKLPVIDLVTEDLNVIQIAEYLLQHKDNSLQSNTDEVDLKIVETMTPYENYIYEMYLRNPSDPSLIIYVDIEVSESVLGPEGWRQIIKQASLQHLALRTLFIPDQRGGIKYNVRKVVIDPEELEVDIQIVDIKELTHTERLPQQNQTFDPAADTPLRVLFSKGENCYRIRFLFNMLAFDLKSIWLFLLDLNKKNDSINEVKLKIDHANILASMDRKFRLDRPRLKSFWLRQFQQPYEPTTLGSVNTMKLDFHAFTFKKLRLPNELCMKLIENLEKRNLTLFQLMVTLYQFILFRLSGKKNITIVVISDMRLHFQEFEKTICRFTNPIPLSLNFSDLKDSLQTCIFENATRIKAQIAHGELPFSELLELAEISSPDIVHRHQLTMEDTSPLHSLSSKHDNRFKVIRKVTGNYNNETALYVWHDQKLSYIEFELGYNTQLMTENVADFALQSLLKLVDIFLHDAKIELNRIDLQTNRETAPAITIRTNDIEVEVEEPMQSIMQNNATEKGNFTYQDNGAFVYKQTTRGWDHLVYLVGGKRKRSSAEDIFLCWGANKHRIKRHLPLHAIVAFDMSIINYKPSLIIETTHRKYVFRASSAQVIESWMSLLKREIVEKQKT